jgi:hypothetical protein
MKMAQRSEHVSPESSAGKWPQRLNLGVEGIVDRIPHVYNELCVKLLTRRITITAGLINIAQRLYIDPVPIRRVLFYASNSNKGNIFIGPENPEFLLNIYVPVEIVIDDLSKVWIRGDTADDVVYMLAEAFTRDLQPRGLY